MNLTDEHIGLSVKVVVNNSPKLTKDNQHKIMHGVIASVDNYVVDKEERQTLTVAIFSPLYGVVTLGSIGTIPTAKKPYVSADSIVVSTNKEVISTNSKDLSIKLIDKVESLEKELKGCTKEINAIKKAQGKETTKAPAKKTAAKKATAKQ